MKKTLFFITRAAVVAGLYLALSAAVQPIAFGPIQFRISEALVLLPLFMPEAIPGLVVGCFFTNFMFSPFPLDMAIGTLATLLCAVGTYLLRKNVFLSAIPPIVINALMIPLIWVFADSEITYYIDALSIFASELIIVGVIGIPLTLALRKALTMAGLVKPQVKKYSAQPYVLQTQADVEDQDEAIVIEDAPLKSGDDVTQDTPKADD